jgi:hypothetical protein
MAYLRPEEELKSFRSVVSENNKSRFLNSCILAVIVALLQPSASSAQSVPGAAGAHSSGSGTAGSNTASHAVHPAATVDLAPLKARVDAEPSDAKARYAYAEGLRQSNRLKEASREYLAATELDPSLYHAYHQLSLTTSDKLLLDEGIGRLNFLKEEKPKDLLLRVALSELYEKKGDNYTAGKMLVELVYQNAVPEKYMAKVNQRIRFLQSKAKNAQGHDKVYGNDELMESNPPPLPEATLNRDLSISKVKEPRVMQGFGHATLLP